MPNNNPQQSSSQQSSQRSEGSQKISERVERTAEQASKLTDRLSETAEQTANAALQRVRDAKLQAQSGLAEQRAQIAERIRRLGGVLRAGSETLSTDDPYAQNVLTMAGDRVERLAEYVDELEPSRIAEDLHTLARRRPGLFFGGAFLIGLGLGRFVKSTGKVAVAATRDLVSDEDYGESSYESDQRTTYDQTSASRREPSQSYVATQRDVGVGSESPTTGNAPSYGSSGSSGTTLPYGVGGGGTGTSSTSPQGTSGSSSSSAFGTTGSTTESRNSTSTTTPRETDRGQGTKS